tara:strand:- start:2800 stop:3426 length:627 start_codon:yes stop_codon:yes gene_type:complete
MSTNFIKYLEISRFGEIQENKIRSFSLSSLIKKCGHKPKDNFSKQHTWNVKIEEKKYKVEFYGKTDGRATFENKYDLPPPLDNTIYFGKCVLILKDLNDSFLPFSIELWDKIYEKLFGGFEDLEATKEEDENEIDELEKIPDKYKTKEGYLKDGFVIDDQLENGDNSTEEESYETSDENSELVEEDFLLTDEEEEEEDDLKQEENEVV